MVSLFQVKARTEIIEIILFAAPTTCILKYMEFEFKTMHILQLQSLYYCISNQQNEIKPPNQRSTYFEGPTA